MRRFGVHRSRLGRAWKLVWDQGIPQSVESRALHVQVVAQRGGIYRQRKR